MTTILILWLAVGGVFFVLLWVGVHRGARLDEASTRTFPSAHGNPRGSRAVATARGDAQARTTGWAKTRGGHGASRRGAAGAG
jgi:hypothetical protein